MGARRVVILDPSVFVQESPEKECVDFPSNLVKCVDLLVLLL